MNLRSPQTLIRIDIADTAQHALVQQQGFDPRAPSTNSFGEFLLAHFKWIGAEPRQLLGKQRFGEVGDAAKTPRIHIAQFAPIIQEHANVSVFFSWLRRWNRRDLSGHPQVHKQRRGRRLPISDDAILSLRRRQPQQHELAVTLHGLNLAARQVLLQCGGIIDESVFPSVTERILRPRILWRNPRATVSTSGSSDRKSTRLNSSHGYISYAVFCLKKKKTKKKTSRNEQKQEK